MKKNYWHTTSMAREVARNLRTTGWFQSKKTMECGTCRGSGERTHRSINRGAERVPCNYCDGTGKVSHGARIGVHYRAVPDPATEEGATGLGRQVIGTQLGVHEANELALELWRRTVAEDPIPSQGDDDWRAEHFRDARQAIIEHFLAAAESVAQIRWNADPFGDDLPADRMVEQLVVQAMRPGGEIPTLVQRLMGAGATYRQHAERLAEEAMEPIPVEFEPEDGEIDLS